MDWIEATLKGRHSECYKSWNLETKRYVDDRRVTIAFDEFVVVLDSTSETMDSKPAL